MPSLPLVGTETANDRHNATRRKIITYQYVCSQRKWARDSPMFINRVVALLLEDHKITDKQFVVAFNMHPKQKTNAITLQEINLLKLCL